MPAGSRTTSDSARAAAQARWAKTPIEGRAEAARRAALAKYSSDQLERAAVKRAELEAARLMPCPHCGNAVGRAGRANCGAAECKRRYQNARMRKFFADYKANHGVKYQEALYGDQYAEVRRAEKRRSGYTESARAADARRRARKRGAEVEKFTNLEIFDRDGWLCGICERSVDPSLDYPHPMSVSLDHIEPLSLGGAHSRENTRCAHLTCNVKRGNRA